VSDKNSLFLQRYNAANDEQVKQRDISEAPCQKKRMVQTMGLPGDGACFAAFSSFNLPNTFGASKILLAC
jgi:hypothetical protein